jgi:NitT/TauT family transport system substrate-binding protein
VLGFPHNRATVHRRAFLATLAAVPAAGPALAQSARIPLRIALIPSDFSGQAYVAKDLGFFERAGLDVELNPISNGAAIQAALVSGAIDVGYSNILAMATAHARSVPFQFICASNYYQHDEAAVGVVAVARTAPIRVAKDLEGKTIAVNGINEIAWLATKCWMDANGADSSKAHFVELTFPAMAAGVASGRVDAATMNLALAPTTGKPGDPLRVIGYSYDAIAPRWAISAWCITPDWVAKHPDAAARFTAAMQQATTWANAHRRETTDILAKYLERSAASIDALPRPTFQTRLTPALIQPAIDQAAHYGLIPAPFPAADLISSYARS